MFHRRGILNREPAFHIFDQRAGGAVLGEGAGVVLLKTLEQAIADRDTIYAVVKALAINNDGRTASPTAPNFQAQRDVMRMALERSGKSPQEISYIAVNGSGSEVTDLLELKAMESVYRQTDSWRCALGSMKPSIGHPLSAEGIASFIHVVLMLHKRQLVPFISAEVPMKHYDFAASPFYFVRSLSPWGEGGHTAAVNCFADGGTNAHVILDSRKSEDCAPTRQPLDPPILHRIDLTEAPAPDRETQGIRGIQNGQHNGAGRGHHKPNGAALVENSPPIGLQFWE
jgi:acyl transferase domain-containing protein